MDLQDALKAAMKSKAKPNNKHTRSMEQARKNMLPDQNFRHDMKDSGGELLEDTGER
jgi:hypothetical protein